MDSGLVSDALRTVLWDYACGGSASDITFRLDALYEAALTANKIRHASAQIPAADAAKVHMALPELIPSVASLNEPTRNEASAQMDSLYAAALELQIETETLAKTVSAPLDAPDARIEEDPSAVADEAGALSRARQHTEDAVQSLRSEASILREVNQEMAATDDLGPLVEPEDPEREP